MQLQNAFAYRDPCSMTDEDYQPLMDLASHFIPCNKSLFWSKTKDLVHRFTKANHDFLTLEDTLVGYIADELSWCGDLATGINYQSCPKWSECENNPGTIYWKMASKMFAEAACGTVQVMLNGSIETGAFRNDSFFGGIEVPNLNPDKISTMHIWLMHDMDGPQSETQYVKVPGQKDYDSDLRPENRQRYDEVIISPGAYIHPIISIQRFCRIL
ncbi:hypothetical protein lerEdw1_019135 [Lerista edwardsae]|nr:hypothetical protein lerEdw1_019135 [Lerista edwardsae]